LPLSYAALVELPAYFSCYAAFTPLRFLHYAIHMPLMLILFIDTHVYALSMLAFAFADYHASAPYRYYYFADTIISLLIRHFRYAFGAAFIFLY